MTSNLASVLLALLFGLSAAGSHAVAARSAQDVPPTDPPTPPPGVPPQEVPPPQDVPPQEVPPEDVPPVDVPPQDVPPPEVPPPQDVPPKEAPVGEGSKSGGTKQGDPRSGTPEAAKPRDDAAPAADAAADAGPLAVLTRHGDPVAFLDAETQREKTLYHWEKSRSMRVGDGVRQGVAGLSEIFFPADQTEIRIFGSAHLFLTASDAQGHRLHCHDLRRVRLEARGTPVIFEVLGGTSVTCVDGVVTIALDDRDHRWRIKNDGPGEVRLDGPILPPGAAAVPAGNSVEIPIVIDVVNAEVVREPAASRDVWNGMTVKTEENVRATRRAADLILEGTGVAHVGGARIVVIGAPVRIWKPRASNAARP